MSYQNINNFGMIILFNEMKDRPLQVIVAGLSRLDGLKRSWESFPILLSFLISTFPIYIIFSVSIAYSIIMVSGDRRYLSFR